MGGLLVLGASGLLGRAVVAEAQRTGESPVTGVRGHPGRAEQADGSRELDLTTAGAPAMVALLESIDPSAVINCVGRTTGDRASLARANVVSVAVVLEALSTWGGAPRFVQVGSAAEYAPAADGASTHEEDPLEPRTVYGATKLAASQMVQLAVRDGEVDGVVARVFNPLGPGMPESSMPGRAARMIGTAAASGLDTVTMGPLDSFRDFVDTRDVAAALLILAQAGGLAHRTFNVGSGVARQARDVVHRIAAASGFHGDVVETDLPSPRSARVAWQRADISRLTALGWSAKHDLGSSISAMVAGVMSDDLTGPGDERRPG